MKKISITFNQHKFGIREFEVVEENETDYGYVCLDGTLMYISKTLENKAFTIKSI
ncbi:MAG: hypothetical protein PHT02_00640 [Tissierellia bacterium]|nr:hypothetical protein [Tissierellia bacterium]